MEGGEASQIAYFDERETPRPEPFRALRQLESVKLILDKTL